jgi:hypothetical protein
MEDTDYYDANLNDDILDDCKRNVSNLKVTNTYLTPTYEKKMMTSP